MFFQLTKHRFAHFRLMSDVFMFTATVRTHKRQYKGEKERKEWKKQAKLCHFLPLRTVDLRGEAHRLLEHLAKVKGIAVAQSKSNFLYRQGCKL